MLLDNNHIMASRAVPFCSADINDETRRRKIEQSHKHAIEWSRRTESPRTATLGRGGWLGLLLCLIGLSAAVLGAVL